MAKEVGIRVTANADPAIRAFDDTTKAMNAVSRTAKTLTNDGADVEKILETIGKRGGESFQQLIVQQQQEGRSLQEIKKAVIDLASEQRRATQDAKRGYLEEAQAAAILQQREADRAKGLAALGQQAAEKIREFDAAIREAGVELQDLEQRLRNAFKDDALAAGVVAKIRDLDDIVGVSSQSLAQAAVNLQKFGVYSDENLTRAAIAAKKAGLGVEEVAAAIGKFQKFGDSRSQLTLKKMLGISAEEVNEIGGIFEAIDAKFGTSTDGLVKKSDLVRGAWGDFTEDIGRGSQRMRDSLLESLGPLLQALSDLPPAAKEAIGATLGVGSSLAGLGTSALQVAANVKMAGIEMSTVMGAITSPIGVAVIAIGALAAGFKYYISTLEAATAKLEGETSAWEKQTQVLRENKAVRDAIREGKPVSEDAATTVLEASIERLKIAEQELADLQEKRRKASDPEAKSSFNPNAYENEIADAQKRVDFLRKEADLAQSAATSAKAEADKKRLVDTYLNVEEFAKSATKAAEAHHAQRLKAALDAIEIETARDTLSHQEKINRYREILQQYVLTADERLQVEKLLAAQEGAIHREAATSRAKADRDAAAERAAAEKAAEKDREDAHQRDLERAKQRSDAERDLRFKIRELEGKSHENRIEEIDDQAKAYSAAGANASDVEKFKQLSIAKIQKEQQDAANRAIEDQNKGLEKSNELRAEGNSLLDEQKKKQDALTFKGVSQTIQEAFGSGQFGFSLDMPKPSSEIFNRMTTGSQPVAAPLSAPEKPIPYFTTPQPFSPTQATASPSTSTPTSAGSIVINAQSVTVNGQQRAAGGSGILERDGYFSK